MRHRMPDYAPFNGCFDTGVKISDIDGILERRGRFLIIEWKEPGAVMSAGQDILFKTLSREYSFMVLFIHGKAIDANLITDATLLLGGREYGPIDMDLPRLQAVFREWWNVVSMNCSASYGVMRSKFVRYFTGVSETL